MRKQRKRNTKIKTSKPTKKIKNDAQAKQAQPLKLSDKSASDLDILRRAHNANYVTEEICSKMRCYCREVENNFRKCSNCLCYNARGIVNYE